VLIIIVQGGLISRAVLRFGEMKTIIAGVALLASGQLLTLALAFADALGLVIMVGPILLSTTLVWVGFALTNPAFTASALKTASARNIGGSLGFIQGCESIGQVLGLVSAGPVYAFGGGVASFGFGTAVTCCLLVFILMMLSRQRRQQKMANGVC